MLIAKTFTDTCPVNTLIQYLAKFKLPSSSDQDNISGFTFSKKQNKYIFRKKNKPLSYTRTREIILNTFEKIGLPRSKFGLHNLRAGGATAAANSGLPDRLFKRHGRWKSENAKDGYIKDNLKALLSVSKNLGI